MLGNLGDYYNEVPCLGSVHVQVRAAWLHRALPNAAIRRGKARGPVASALGRPNLELWGSS